MHLTLTIGSCLRAGFHSPSSRPLQCLCPGPTTPGSDPFRDDGNPRRQAHRFRSAGQHHRTASGISRSGRTIRWIVTGTGSAGRRSRWRWGLRFQRRSRSAENISLTCDLSADFIRRHRFQWRIAARPQRGRRHQSGRGNRKRDVCSFR